MTDLLATVVSGDQSYSAEDSRPLTQDTAGKLRTSDPTVAGLLGGAGPATATIAYNPAASESNAIVVTDHMPGGFYVSAVPSSGYIGIKVSPDLTNYGRLYVDGALVFFAVALGGYYGLGSYAGSLQGIKGIVFVNCDATGAAVNQATADATLIVGRA